MLRQTHCHVSFTRLGISSSNNKLYRLLYIRVLNSHVNECPGGNLIWARMSGVVIWCEHECPGWSFDMSMNVRSGNLMWARMSGVVIWCEHECPALSKTNVNECPYTGVCVCPSQCMSMCHDLACLGCNFIMGNPSLSVDRFQYYLV